MVGLRDLTLRELEALLESSVADHEEGLAGSAELAQRVFDEINRREDHGVPPA